MESAVRYCAYAEYTLSRSEAYLYDPYWRLLLATQYPLCPDDTRLRVDGAVNDVYRDDMRAVWVGVLVPHPNHDVMPWVPAATESGEHRGVASWYAKFAQLTHS